LVKIRSKSILYDIEE